MLKNEEKEIMREGIYEAVKTSLPLNKKVKEH